MLCRFYDIVAENDDMVEFNLEKDYILEIPEGSTDTPMERQERIGTMFDMIVAASGHNVCSFRTESM